MVIFHINTPKRISSREASLKAPSYLTISVILDGVPI